MKKNKMFKIIKGLSLFCVIFLGFSGAVHAQSIPASCLTWPKPGKGLERTKWDVLKTAQLFCASAPNANWQNITVHINDKPQGRRFGWAMKKNRSAHVAFVGNMLSQVEILHHELMGHLIPGAWEHDDYFRRSRMASAVKLGWLTQAEMDRALKEGLKERIYQKWMYPRIQKWLEANHLLK